MKQSNQNYQEKQKNSPTSAKEVAGLLSKIAAQGF